MLNKNIIGLLEASRDAFHYPDEQNWLMYRENIIELIKWGVSRNISRSKSLYQAAVRDQLITEELQIDHTRLFINSKPHALAHPFAGWHMGDRVLFDMKAMELKEFYTLFDVYLEDDSMAPDHIMVELEFVSLMMEQYHKTGEEKYYQAVKQMISNHMIKWIPVFADAIKQNAQSDYYKMLAATLEVLIAELQEEMKGVA